MGYFEAFILGIIEGITEFLPVSSTAHLILTNNLLNVQQTDFVKSFEIAIQLGAILSVVYLYWRDLFVNKEVAKRVIAAFVPTAVLAFLLYKIIKGILFESNAIIIGALMVGGIGLIVFELLHKESESAIDELSSLPYLKCLTLGLCQTFAVIPGVSRSAATIIGGLLLGMKRKAIVEFSFLLAVPTMLSATGYDLLKSGGSFATDQIWVLAVGFGVSFVVALLSIKFLLSFIRTNSFISFGVYRILVGILLIGIFTLR